LALHAWGQEAPTTLEQLLAKQRPDGSWDGNVYVTATTLMLLEGGWPLEKR
jgi:hypothetical protein